MDPIDPMQTLRELCAHDNRLAGSDAERRAARRLADELAGGGREVLVETFWCRPNWALAHCWHVLAALIGSLLAVSDPRAGVAVTLVALLSTISDGLFGASLGRLLTPERASQNVVALPPVRARSRSVRLLLTANYDAGRGGFVHREALRGLAARLRAALGGRTLGWLGWTAVGIACLVAAAIARLDGAGGTAIAVAQLIPTIGLILALAALADIATSPAGGPAAGDNAAGVAAAMAAVAALDAELPAHAAVHLVLCGAGNCGGPGLRVYLRSRRRSLRPPNTVLVGVGPCGGGLAACWQSEGPLVPVRHHAALRALCSAQGAVGHGPHPMSVRARAATPALWARMAGIPSIAIGVVSSVGVSPRSHLPGDTPEAVGAQSLKSAVDLTIALSRAIDEHLGQLAHARPASSRRARTTA